MSRGGVRFAMKGQGFLADFITGTGACTVRHAMELFKIHLPINIFCLALARFHQDWVPCLFKVPTYPMQMAAAEKRPASRRNGLGLWV